ncbi:MAG: arginine--tRNA ligase [Methanobacteriaceae archaeon]|nr:arginine--tRNA ligase [Methanobacteriaceae archaeon]
MYLKIKDQLKRNIQETLNELNWNITDEIVLEQPPNKGMGDLSCNIAFVLAKKLHKSPVEISKKISEKIELPLYITEVKTVGPYINFYINYQLFTNKVVNSIDENYGELAEKETRIILEHTSANPNGPLHIGHLRNSILGDSLKRILEKAGNKVETQYYVNDMGRQIAIIAWGILNHNIEIKKDKKIDHAIGETYFKSNKLLGEDPENAKEINDILLEYEKGNNPELIETFKNIVEQCLDGIKETETRLNIKHDLFKWESSFLRNNDVEEVLEKLQPFTIEDEILYLPLERYGIDKELILRRSNGTSLYSTRDLAYHQYKSVNSDKMIDVLGADHKLAIKQLSIALELSNNKKPETVFYEFIDLPSGSMSTRKGKFVSVDEFIEESIKHAREEIEKRDLDLTEAQKTEVSEIIGIGAIRFYITQISAEKTITFKWEEALSFERGCASIQYAHARASKLLKKATFDPYENIHYDYELEEEEKKLIRIISQFPEKIIKTAENKKVHYISEYSLELSKAFNKFYKTQQVLGSEYEQERLHIVDAARITIKNSLKLLGIKSPEYM